MGGNEKQAAVSEIEGTNQMHHDFVDAHSALFSFNLKEKADPKFSITVKSSDKRD